MNSPEIIQNLIYDDKQAQALEAISKYFNSKNGSNNGTIAHLLGRLRAVDRDFKGGLIPYAEYQLEKNKIRYSIIELNEELKELEFSETIITNNKKQTLKFDKPSIRRNEIVNIDLCELTIKSKCQFIGCEVNFTKTKINISGLGQLSFQNCKIRFEKCDIESETAFDEIIIKNSQSIFRKCIFLGLYKLSIKNLAQSNNNQIEIEKCDFKDIKTSIHIEQETYTYVIIRNVTILNSNNIGIFMRAKNSSISNVVIQDTKIGIKCLLEHDNELGLEKISIENAQKAIEITVYNGESITTITNIDIKNVEIGIYTEMEEEFTEKLQKRGEYEMLGKRIVLSKTNFADCKIDLQVESFKIDEK